MNMPIELGSLEMPTLWRFRALGSLCFVILNLSSWGQFQATPTKKSVSREEVFSRAVDLYQMNERQKACSLFEQLKTDPPSSPLLQLYLLGCAIWRPNGLSVELGQRQFDRLDSPASGRNEIAGDWLAAGGHCLEAEQEYARAPTGKAVGANEYGLGQCYQKKGDRPSAIAEYRKALELDPAREEHYLSLASLLIINGDFEEAGKILTEGEDRFPKSVRLVIAMSLLRLDLGYPDEALIEYERAKSLAPDTPAVWKLLGMIQRTQGDFPNAVKSFEHAAVADKKDAQTYLFMGLAQERIKGGTDAALIDFERAAEIAPGLMDARFAAASIYLLSKGDSARAISLLMEITAAAPNYAPAYRLLAQAYQRLGAFEKADAASRKYRQLNTSSETASPPTR